MSEEEEMLEPGDSDVRSPRPGEPKDEGDLIDSGDRSSEITPRATPRVGLGEPRDEGGLDDSGNRSSESTPLATPRVSLD